LGSISANSANKAARAEVVPELALVQTPKSEIISRMNQLPSELPALFKGRHFDRLLIIQSVRWYITYKLSYRDVLCIDG
jgi:hypothetical protein